MAEAAPEPKYRQIASELLLEIRKTMGVGAKLPPEQRLAERFGVHVLTIREALRILQEGGVIQRQRAIGTRVINPLGGNWVSIVCEMDVFSPHSHSLFHRSVIYHLRHFLREAGLPSRVSIGESEPGSKSNTQLTSLDFVADIEANRLAGVLALSVNPTDYWLKKLEKQGVPTVGSNTLFPHCVMFAPLDDLNKALRSLLDFNRNRIAYIGWMDRSISNSNGLPAALDELQKCYPGILRKEWIKCDMHPEHPGAGWEEFREIWASDKEKPNGLIIDDEHLLPDVERALLEHGIRVPEDLIIVCHRTRGNTRPPLFPMIIMETDPRLYAYRMADSFLRLYRGEKLPNQIATVSRILIDDALRQAPNTPTPVWASATPGQ